MGDAPDGVVNSNQTHPMVWYLFQTHPMVWYLFKIKETAMRLTPMGLIQYCTDVCCAMRYLCQNQNPPFRWCALFGAVCIHCIILLL